MNTIAVGVEIWSAEARPLILHAASLAAEIRAAWMAIVVSDAAHELSRLTADEQQRVRQNTDLIMSLGGTPCFCEGDDVAAVLVAAATLHGARILVLGKPRHRGFIGRLFGREVTGPVMDLSSDLSVVFVGGR